LLIKTKIKHVYSTLLAFVRKNNTLVTERDLHQFSSAKNLVDLCPQPDASCGADQDTVTEKLEQLLWADEGGCC